MAAGSTYTPIATTTLGSATLTVTFSSISGSYTDLVLIIGGKNASSDQGIVTQVGNGSIDTGSNYSTTYLIGDGTSATSGRASSATSIIAGRMDNVASTSIINYMNYSNTTTYKTVLGRGNDGTLVIQHVGLWRNTAAINTINVFNLSSVNFATGTVLTLYGIAAA
jgi:hypothetical protein